MTKIINKNCVKIDKYIKYPYLFHLIFTKNEIVTRHILFALVTTVFFQLAQYVDVHFCHFYKVLEFFEIRS